MRVSFLGMNNAFYINLCNVSNWNNVSIHSTQIVSSNHSLVNTETNYVHCNTIIQESNAISLIVNNGQLIKEMLSTRELELLKIYNLLNIKNQTLLLSYAFNLADEQK